MTREGRRPEWVVPSAWQVSDLAGLATRAVSMQADPECGGMLAAIGWVHGRLAGPVTGREERPARRELAVAELWAADAAQPGTPAPPLAELSLMLRVEHRDLQPADPRFARGVWRTLRWLTGTDDQPAPLELPIRAPDGRVADADGILAALKTRQGVVAPEELAGLRARAERLAERSRRLAAVIADMQASRDRGG